MDIRTFQLPVAVTLRIQSRSGGVHVIAEPRDDVRVEGDHVDAAEEDQGAVLRIRCGRGSSKVLVRCPVGTDVTVGTQSGSVRMEGEFGDVSVTTMSGKIELDRADDADLRSMSGDIIVGACRGRGRMSTASGKVSAGEMDSASASTMSGSIKIDRVVGDARARTVSGTVEMSCCGEGAIAVKTVSGTVRIALPGGTEVDPHFKTMSGRVSCPFPRGADCRIDATSVSGSIDVTPS